MAEVVRHGRLRWFGHLGMWNVRVEMIEPVEMWW